jgi:hypoxanthine phosphoribosyltransferase
MEHIPGELELYLDAESIAYTVSQIANAVDTNSQGVSLTVIGLLKGSFMFLADLLRQIETPVANVEFLRMSSYGSNTVSSGNPYRLDELSDIVVEGKDILVIDDIVDTGLTTKNVRQYLWGKNPASLRLCCLLDKPERRQVNVHVDYIGVTVPDLFLVGYGLDLDDRYRQLPSIYSISQ